MPSVLYALALVDSANKPFLSWTMHTVVDGTNNPDTIQSVSNDVNKTNAKALDGKAKDLGLKAKAKANNFGLKAKAEA